MASFFLGVLSVFAFFTFVAAARLLFFRRRWRRHGCGPRGRYAGHPVYGEERFARAAGEVLKRRLRIDEEQEPVVDHALRDLRAALAELGKELGDTRGAVAEAFRGEAVDDAALAAAFARQDDAVGRARREVVSALKQVHAVLEPDQRERAADLLAKGGLRWA